MHVLERLQGRVEIMCRGRLPVRRAHPHAGRRIVEQGGERRGEPGRVCGPVQQAVAAGVDEARKAQRRRRPPRAARATNVTRLCNSAMPGMQNRAPPAHRRPRRRGTAPGRLPEVVGQRAPGGLARAGTDDLQPGRCDTVGASIRRSVMSTGSATPMIVSSRKTTNVETSSTPIMMRLREPSCPDAWGPPSTSAVN
ncbi:hypothetical protein ACOBQX_08065 [Actinokineospora sp. G85]|uniref:hypothetical protein n=1 Tax=Actinokineospora sp. G85 TaxID=3406626 RepID=UPI003C77D3AE